MTSKAKALCNQYLNDMGIIKKDDRKLAITMFYLGFYQGKLPAYVTICLMSGRHEELT
jgi:hypothetical protein